MPEQLKPLINNQDALKQRQEKRKELRELLPVDLQLEFVTERPEKDKWQLEGRLMGRRHSDIDEDKLFIEAVKSIDDKDTDQLTKLKEKSQEKKEQIAKNLDDFIFLKQAMQKLFDKGRSDSAGEIALALNDKESAKQAMQECFDKGWLSSAGEIVLALNDKESAKQAMQKCFDEGYPDSASKIAVALADKNPESAKQAMQKLFDEGWPNSTSKIAVALADKNPESAKQAMQKYFDEGWSDSAVAIAVALADKDPESAKQAMQACFNKGYPDSAVAIAVALADKDPESAKQAMQKCFDEGWPGSASKIAVVLADKNPELAKQAMQECFNKGWPDSVVVIAVALADKNPELAKQAMQKLFDKGRSDSASKIAVVLAKNFKPSKEFERVLKIIDKTETGIYGQKTIANLLEQNQDLKLFKKEYLSRYLFIKKLAEKANSEIEESKKWENPEEFFIKYNLDIVNFQSIDLNLSTQLLKNLISRGLSFSEANLDIYRKTLNNPKTLGIIKTYIKSNKNLDGYNFSDLLEISSAYLSLNEDESLIKIIDSQTKSFAELKSKLNAGLLEKLASSLDLKIKVSNQELSDWNIKYFANLITNREMIKAKADKNDLETHDAVLKSVFEDRFQEFITDKMQKDEMGREIAEHNQKVEEEFKERNINWNNWLNFKEQVIMTIGTQKKQDREALFNQFEQRFKIWQEQVNKSESRLKASLEKDLTQLNQKKKEFDPSKINLNDQKWTEELLPTFTKTVHYLKSKNPDFKLPQEVEESFQHLVETIKTLTQKQQKEQTAKKEFNVKLWDRDPRKDLFQGNHTHCCISVGVKETPPGGGFTTLHPETIFQYLIDKGINVAEIVDLDTNDVIAQTWLFVTLDKNNQPILVADNFEVNNRYPAGNNVNRGVREAMFQFLIKYAKECNISRVVLGKVGTNDVETDDLKSINLSAIKKLGGYLEDKEYYLETLDDTDAWGVE